MQLFGYAILGFALAEATLRRTGCFILLFIIILYHIKFVNKFIKSLKYLKDSVFFITQRLLNRITLKFTRNNIYINKLPINQLGNRVTRVAEANELLLLGLGVSEMYTKPVNNVVIPCYRILLRSERLVIISSLTRVNCHHKTGSSARVSSKVLVTLRHKWQ